MMTRRLLTLAAAGALIIATACGGDDDSAPADTVSVAEAASDDGDTEAMTVTDDTDDTDASEVDTPDAEVPEPEPEPEALPPVIDGLDPIVLLTPASGGGDRPLLEWQPAPGAEVYMVVVYGADGAATWSMITDATSIYVGGRLPIPSANSGPRITDGSSWVVYADDIDGRPIAASGRAPIAP
jgi:hypothetical protein